MTSNKPIPKGAYDERLVHNPFRVLGAADW